MIREYLGSLKIAVCAIAVMAALLVAGTATADGEIKFTFGGYVKLDAMLTDYNDGELPAGSGLRDFHVPGAIPVGGQGESSDVDFHARESRFNLAVEREAENGKKLKAFFEVDFLLSPGGDERISNSYNPRVRHAYLSYDKWLFGQTWMTFMIIALPEDLDFIGVTEGTIFGRQAQIRYTNGPWQFALENPETTVTPFGGGGRIVTDDASVPDIVARYNHKKDWGFVSVAAIARQLKYQDNATNIDDSASGWGVSVGGSVKTGGKDDIVFMATTGSGLGRYLALNTANGAVLDANGNLEAIDSSAGFIGYRHWWNDRLRTSINYSVFTADNDVFLGGAGATKDASSYSINLLYSPTPSLTIGGEYMHAERSLENGLDGDFDRFQFSAKWAFNFSTSTGK